MIRYIAIGKEMSEEEKILGMFMQFWKALIKIHHSVSYKLCQDLLLALHSYFFFNNLNDEMFFSYE